MAQRFIDSFDHYSTAECDLKWTTASVTIGTPYGRHDQGARLLGFVERTIDYQPSWVVGFAWEQIPSAGTNVGPLYQLFANDKAIFQLFLEADDTLYCVAGNSNFFANIPLPINLNTWYYVECSIDLSGDPISVTVTVKINGNTWVSAVTASTGVAVASTLLGLCKANAHKFSAVSGNNTNIDDVYILDGTGTNNTFYGDVTISAIYAESDNSIQWAPFPATPTTSFDKISIVPPPYDADYIFDSTVGHVDLFNWNDISSFTGTVQGVQMSMFARKDDEGYRAITAVVGSFVSPMALWSYLGDSYVYYVYNWDENPDLVLPWTVANFNAQTFGVKVAL